MGGDRFVANLAHGKAFWSGCCAISTWRVCAPVGAERSADSPAACGYYMELRLKWPRRSHYRFTGLDGSTGNDSLRYGHCFLIKSLSLSLSLSPLHMPTGTPELGRGWPRNAVHCFVYCLGHCLALGHIRGASWVASSSLQKS